MRFLLILTLLLLTNHSFSNDEIIQESLSCKDYRVELTHQRNGDEGWKVSIQLFLNNQEKAKQYIKANSNHWVLLPELIDINGDSFMDLSFINEQTARGSNELRAFYLFDPKGDSLKLLKGNIPPYLSYDTSYNRLSSISFAGSMYQSFHKIVNDSLIDIAHINNGSVREVKYVSNGKWILKKYPMVDQGPYFDGFTSFDNFNPLMIGDSVVKESDFRVDHFLKPIFDSLNISSNIKQRLVRYTISNDDKYYFLIPEIDTALSEEGVEYYNWYFIEYEDPNQFKYLKINSDDTEWYSDAVFLDDIEFDSNEYSLSNRINERFIAIVVNKRTSSRLTQFSEKTLNIFSIEDSIKLLMKDLVLERVSGFNEDNCIGSWNEYNCNLEVLRNQSSKAYYKIKYSYNLKSTENYLDENNDCKDTITKTQKKEIILEFDGKQYNSPNLYQLDSQYNLFER